MHHRVDPNASTNRVLTDAEGLHDLAVSTSKITENLDTEVENSQASYPDRGHQLQQQMREDETQTQLHDVKAPVDSTVGHGMTIAARLDDQRILLHPIHRLPSELLLDIFDEVMKTSIERLKDVICLSAVCRAWREAAHSSPRLWCRFIITPLRWSEAFCTKMAQVIKSRPADISIESIETNDLQRLRTWPLSRIINLTKLNLNFSSDFNGEFFPQNLLTEPYFPLKELVITTSHFFTRNYSFAMTISCHSICAQFPSLVSLTIRRANLDHLPSMEMPSLKVLILDESIKVDIAHIAKTFPRLETMELRSVSLEDISSPPIMTSFNVQKLTLIETPLLEAPWVETVKFPCLEWLLYDDSITPSVTDFIKSLPNIRKLDCSTKDDTVIEFANYLPKLQELIVTSSLDIFVNWRSYGLRYPPFPSLRRLGLADPWGSMNELSFEAIVRARCLPQDHPKSLLEDPSLMINEFVVALSEPEWERKPWASNPLAKEAVKDIVPYEVIPKWFCLVMKWHSL